MTRSNKRLNARDRTSLLSAVLFVLFLTMILALPQTALSATYTWSPAGSLATKRAYHTAILLPNGKVLVAGGKGNSGVLASAELYDPVSKTWSATGDMAMARYGHTATLLHSGKVLVGGR
jgi:hypothetical protein